MPVPGGVIADMDYTGLCEMNLADRRIWTITAAVAGVLAIAAAIGIGALSKRSRFAHRRSAV